ncbi:MAG: lysylphosphatidylglycerol synthase transmembrane domain-containing protein [Chlorobiota bacterium]
MSKVKTILKYGISLILLVGSVYLTIDGIDFDKLYNAILDINYFWVIAPLPIVILSHLMRAIRWKLFLSPFHDAKSIKNLFSATMVGYLFNNVSPRGGELVRPYIYSKREKISYSSTFATILVERILDLITLGVLIAIVLIWNSDQVLKAFPEDTDPMKLVFVSGFILLVLFLALYPPTVKFVLDKLIKPFSEKIYNKLNELFEKFRQGFAIIKRPSKYARIAAESLFIWVLYALPLYLLFFAFGFETTYNLGLEDALLLVIVSGIGVTIAPTPGAIGVYHYLVTTALVQLYGIGSEVGLAYATVAHAASKLMELLLGGLFFIRENISKMPTEEELEEEIV